MSFVCSYCGSSQFEINDLDHDVITCQHCGMKQHLNTHDHEEYRPQSPHQQLMTCQQLLRCTDIVENIAWAAFMNTYYFWLNDEDNDQTDAVEKIAESRSWLMTYCSTYRELLEAVPEENEDGLALFSWFIDETDYDSSTDVFLFQPTEHRIPLKGRKYYENYALDAFTPEQCAGAVVPRALLHQVPIGDIAAKVLLEYSCRGSARSRPGSWLCIFRAAELRLAKMAVEQFPSREKDFDETLAHSCREFLAERHEKGLTIERVLEEFDMSFEQYDVFLKQVPHTLQLLDSISLIDLHQTIQFLRNAGYTQEELCALYTASPQLMTWRFEQAKIGFTEQGTQMTRFMARIDPYHFEELMEHSLKLEKEFPYHRLYVQATAERIRYAMERDLYIDLKVDPACPYAEDLDEESAAPMYLIDEGENTSVVCCLNYDRRITVPLSDILEFSIADYPCELSLHTRKKVRRKAARLEEQGHRVWPYPHKLT